VKPEMDAGIAKPAMAAIGMFVGVVLFSALAVQELAIATPVTTVTCGLWSVTTAEEIRRVENYRTWSDWEVVDNHSSQYAYIVYDKAECTFETI